MIKFKIQLCLFGLIFLSGCGDGFSNGFGLLQSDKEKLAQLETTKQIPILDRTETLAGIDANSNGVRDDIEAYINNLSLNNEQRMALLEEAKNLQQSLLVDKTNKILLRSVADKGGLTISCFFYRFNNNPISRMNPDQVTAKIESMTSNTKLRLKEYLLFAKALDGATFSHTEGSEACRQLGL